MADAREVTREPDRVACVVRALRDGGMSVRDIAAATRASRATVHGWLDGVPVETDPTVRLTRVHALLTEAGFATGAVWRFANRRHEGAPSLREALAAEEVDEATLRRVLVALAPLVVRQAALDAARGAPRPGRGNPVLDEVPVAVLRG